jgi:hypothetical protein
LSHRISFTYDRQWAQEVCHMLKIAMGIVATFHHTRSGYNMGRCIWRTYTITVEDKSDALDAREFLRGWKVATEQVRGDPRVFAKGFNAGVQWMLKEAKPKLKAQSRKEQSA